MMKIFKKLFYLFKYKHEEKQNDEIINDKGSISFSFTNEQNMNIQFMFPNISEKEGYYDDNELVKQSELYAQMLILINSGSYRQIIINSLKQIANNNSDNNTKLLASNILSFFIVLEKATNIYTVDNRPKVLPTEVFKI